MSRRLVALIVLAAILVLTATAVGGCGRREAIERARSQATLSEAEQTLDELQAILDEIGAQEEAQTDFSGR